TVVVYNPDDGSIPTAVITYPGQISSIQVFNKYGLIVENNDGSNSGDPHRLFGERIPFMIKDLMAMMDCKDLETLDIYLKTARIHYPLIYNTASPSGAYCYEMTTDEVKRRKPADGLLIGINHFVSPDWKPIDPNIPNYIDNSKTRYCNMETLVNKNKGSIDAKVMMSILDTSVSQGGPTPEDKSIYQYVAEPGSLKIYLKAREYCNWTEINLKKFFSGSKD
ncbi:MAG: hypothetical protein LWY06_07900, partial [Firmicutes bacterium]|nr:hypothetical protein [Bacillota bacterium]